MKSKTIIPHRILLFKEKFAKYQSVNLRHVEYVNLQDLVTYSAQSSNEVASEIQRG